MATALILGANGFVGPWLARELASHDYHVCASDVQDESSPRLECDFYMPSNLLDPDSLSLLLEATRPDQVYNLAAVSSVGQSWRNPALTMRVNVEGVINLLEACRAMDPMPRVLLVGSSEEYAPSMEPLTEDSPLAATSPYGISKETQGRIAEMYYREYGLQVYRVRAFNHTGPGQTETFVLPSWCKQVAKIDKSGKPGIVRVGNLEVARDFSDVRDVVRAYRTVVESWNPVIPINIGSGVATTLEILLSKIVSFTGQTVVVETDSNLLRPSDNPVICCDNSLLKNRLAWNNEFDIDTTLEDLYKSFVLQTDI